NRGHAPAAELALDHVLLGQHEAQSFQRVAYEGVTHPRPRTRGRNLALMTECGSNECIEYIECGPRAAGSLRSRQPAATGAPSAASISAADGQRESCSLASARLIVSIRTTGVSGRSWRRSGGGSCICWCNISIRFGWLKGGRPATASNRRQPVA